MANPSKRQRATIAGFLKTSRTYFNLGPGGHRARGGRTLQTVVRSLLIAGSIGAPVGGIAYADQFETKVSESREDQRQGDSCPSAIASAQKSGIQRGMLELQAGETHSQFVERASRIFQNGEVAKWSRLERAVFNHLMAQLIYRHGYAGISNQMLQDVRNEMSAALKRVTVNQPSHAQLMETPAKATKS